MSYNKNDGTYNGYIYLITNIINNKKYVGLTSTTVHARWRRHVNITKKRAEKDFCVIDLAIKKYGEENFNIETLAIISSKTEKDLWDDMNKLEKQYIHNYNTLWKHGYGNGYNVDEGGNSGTVNYKPVDAYNIDGTYIGRFKSRLEAADYFDISDSTIIDICKGRKSSYKSRYVFRNTEDSFDKFDITSHSMYRNIYQFSLDGAYITNYHSCQEVPYDFRWRIWEVIDNPYKTCGGFWWSSINKFNYKCNQTYRPVDMYDLNGNLLKSYKTISDCANDTNINKNCIRDCCNGKQKTANGYTFRNKGEPFNKFSIDKKQSPLKRKINKYSLSDEYIETFDSISDAAKSTNAKTLSQISGCCLHRKNCKTAYGYKWFYTNDITQPDKTKIMN